MREWNSEAILYVKVALLFLEGRCSASVSPQTPLAPAEKVRGLSRQGSQCRARWRRVSRNLHNARIFQDPCWISVIIVPYWKYSTLCSSLWEVALCSGYLLITWSNEAVELTDDAAAGGPEVRLVVHALIDQISQLSPLGRRQLLETLIKLLLLQNTQTLIKLGPSLPYLCFPHWSVLNVHFNVKKHGHSAQITARYPRRYHVQIPAEERIVPVVEELPQRGAKAPLITLQSQVIRG